MNYYNEIKNELIKNEVSKKVREYYTNKNSLSTYYNVGKLLSEAGKHYGEGIIKEYSKKLEIDINKKYSVSTLKRIRQFYQIIQKGAPLAHQLTWSHYQELLSLKDIGEMVYYINEISKYQLSKRELRKRIKNNEYKRLDNNTKKKLIQHDNLEIADYIKNPIILNKKANYEKISEIVLKEIILNDLDDFLNQLGLGFCYIGNEYRIKIGDTYNYIDILLFNIIYNCYVVVELKINKLTKQDLGQIMIYMNYINENIRNINQDYTIGIIVCKENNKYLIKYSTDPRIHATTYEIV